MKHLLVILLAALCVSVDAQYKRRLNPIFTESPGYPRSGWFWELGVTYAYTEGDVNDAIIRETTDSLVVANLSPSGFPLGYVGIGRFNLLPNPIINMIDYSIGFRSMAFNQDLDAILYFKNDNIAPPENYTDEGRRTDYSVTVNLNFNRYFQISESFFIMPGIGMHGDFRVTGRDQASLDSEITGYTFPPTIQARAHARLNVGFKVHRELFIVPGLEANLIALDDFENQKITTTYFNSEYWPLMFSVKIMYHKTPRLRPCKVGVSDIDLDNTRRRKRKIQLF